MGFVDFKLNGKAVAIPTETSLDLIALHRPVAGDNVFECARKDVTIMWESSSEGGAVVKTVRLCLFRVIEALFKNLLAIPKRKDLVFELRKINVSADGRKGGIAGILGLRASLGSLHARQAI